MTALIRSLLAAALAVVVFTGCASRPGPAPGAAADADQLVGAWRTRITFQGGALAEMQGLEFLSVYNAGGTMTESSNYDEASNSSPPAYGAWKQTGPGRYETRYVFWTTQAAGPGEGARGNSDWWPAGHGVLTESITLAADGRTYTSTIHLDLFDRADQPVSGGGDGTGEATRIEP